MPTGALHPITVSRWQQEFLEKGAEVFDKNRMVAQYEKRIQGMERLLGRAEAEIALLRNLADSSL